MPPLVSGSLRRSGCGGVALDVIQDHIHELRALPANPLATEAELVIDDAIAKHGEEHAMGIVRKTIEDLERRCRDMFDWTRCA